ncbi:hypothetical protein SAY87_027245 [Trapa incisa]|uniref:EF-hand domain-containing protein n=1 Tax=Trapa incisa TaxID=236973 RepID=A0AAN7JER0_9MYRT|nr:hypothetical protein SAY87_027245 [Trapa incisa]
MSQLAKQLSNMDRTRDRILAKAFNLIDEDKAGFINKKQCIYLFEELKKYRTLPKISVEEFELIFNELDDSHDFKINLDEFSDLCNAIALRFQKEETPSLFEKFPGVYSSPASKKLKDFVRSSKFGYVISFILIMNLVAVMIETTLDIENNSGQKVWQTVEFVFGWVYVLEMALKVYSFGFDNYWRGGHNRFDFLITWIIAIGETITFIAPDGLEFLSNGEWIRYLLLARMFRLIRLLMYVQRYRAFVATFLALIPSLMPYLGIIFCILCLYCSLGEQIFGGIVNAGNTKLNSTALYEKDYLLFNFNDYPNGMITLFCLMSNWIDWMQSYKELTGSTWTLVYFISFYLVTVLLLLNLVVAFVLEAFFAEMDLETSERCGERDKESGRGKDQRRSVGTKTRSQRVDMLLHHMLSAELDKESCSNPQPAGRDWCSYKGRPSLLTTLLLDLKVMERLLLIGEGSQVVSRRDRFSHRSDAITYGSPYQKAAALVDLAEDGVGLPEEILDRSHFEKAAKNYFAFIRFDFLWSLNYFALIVLNFLEKPLWCARYTTDVCSERDYYYLGQLPYLTGAESLIYEGITMIILATHLFFPLGYEGRLIYWGKPLNQLKVVCLLILIVDLVAFAICISPVAFDSLPFRVAPYIRVVLFILNIRELRNSIIVLTGMLGTYLNILALLLLFLLFSSWVAYVMFEDTKEGKTEFTSYGATLYQMFVLYTTSNNPDVWLAAYKISRWYSLFFVLYILLAVYFVTNLILAVVYDSFKGELAKQLSDMDRTRDRILTKAFNLIDEDNVGFINKRQCICLFEELNKYRTLPNISRDDFELIFDELDDSHDFKINLEEFSDLCNAIALRFQKEETPSLFDKFPRVYNSSASKKLKDFIRSPKFGYAISFVLILNLVAVIIETTLDIENSSAQKVWQTVEFVFGWVYVLEMALKVYSFGFENYWRDGQNRFDFLITWVIVIGETLTFVAPNGLDFLSNGEWIRYLLLARMFRLIRLLMYVQRYRAFIATFLTLIPSLIPYLGIIFCILCIYCSLGEQIFGGIVNAGSSKLNSTALYDDGYMLFNFNDYPNGMVTLFCLMVMNNWQDWMKSYEELTGSTWTLVYFISFYLITVLLLLNLVVAFVLEAFFAEMDLETSQSSVEQDKGSGRGKDRRRSVGTKTRSQRVDILLHRMLSAELDKEGSCNP